MGKNQKLFLVSTVRPMYLWPIDRVSVLSSIEGKAQVREGREGRKESHIINSHLPNTQVTQRKLG